MAVTALVLPEFFLWRSAQKLIIFQSSNMILSSVLNMKLKTLKFNVKSKNKKSKNFVCHAIEVSKIYF